MTSKKLICFSLCLMLLFSLCSYGQSVFTFSDTLTVRQAFSIFPEPALNDDVSLTGAQDIIQDPKLVYQNGDLVLSFQLDDMSLKEPAYQLTLLANINNQGYVVPAPGFLKGDLGQLTTIGKEGSEKQIVWKNVLEQHKLVKHISLKVVARISGTVPVDCNSLPVFGAKQKTPIFIVGGIGLAGIGAGLLYENSSKGDYDIYLQNKYDNASAQFYDDANSKHKTAIIMASGGAVLVAGAVVYYLLKSNSTKKKKKRYEKYCVPKMTINPIINLDQQVVYSGLQFHYHF